MFTKKVLDKKYVSGQGDVVTEREVISIPGIVTAALAAFLALVFITGGVVACSKEFNRYQRRADAENNVKVSAIQIHNQEQRVKIAQQKAQIRFVEATGIKKAQDEISGTLTPLYVQHEMIQALRESGATTVYIPTDPASGLPVVTTRNAGGK
jgi:hypothetical protein